MHVDSEDIVISDGEMVLGKKLENPYSVENMKRALESLSPETRSGIDVSDEAFVQVTHFYVKFEPQSYEELDVLKRDSTLNLYPYPLDYEIEVYGSYYHDPIISDSLPTYQYAAVEKGYEFPQNVKFTILEELFIPDEYNDDGVLTRSSSSIGDDFIEELVSAAMEITNNQDDGSPITRGSSSWRPSGRISYYDDVLNSTIGVEGVKVKARRWFTTHTGFANAAGYYYCDGTFKRDANYSFDLERHEFQVNGEGMAVSYNGPKKKRFMELSLFAY